MGALTTEGTERLQLPDVRRPERMPSLPAWVALRIDSLKVECQPDKKTGKWREMPTLPASLILTVVEREELMRHASDLHVLCQQTPENDPRAEAEMLELLTKMMWVLPSMTQNEFSAEARGEALMESLSDIPTWAVRAAIRSFHRGNAGRKPNGDEYDYHWCPAPAELRRISCNRMFPVRRRARELQELLNAEPLIEFSAEHRDKMRGRFDALLHSLKHPPVGKDGSGGAASEELVEGAHCGTQPKHSPA
jgi:hypothetical protein